MSHGASTPYARPMTAPVRVRVVHQFASDPTTVFEALAEHENLSRVFFPCKVTRKSDGATERNGVGSARWMQIGPLPKFVETTTNVVRGELIEYEITEGIVPLFGHWGRQVLTPTADGGTELAYTIGFNSLPGLAQVVGFALTDAIKRGMPKLVP